MLQPFRTDTIDPQGKRVIPNVSIETSIIVERIKARAVPNRQVDISYTEAASWIGRDIRSYPGFLGSAKRILLREHGILVETVRSVGLRIGSEADKIKASAMDMGRARRSLGRASRKLEAVDYQALTDEERKEFNSRASVIGTLRFLGSPASIRKVEQTGPTETLPSATVLDMLRK